ncbi:4002_t:CDS:2, partial [Entrophospora sp. SA101]
AEKTALVSEKVAEVAENVAYYAKLGAEKAKAGAKKFKNFNEAIEQKARETKIEYQQAIRKEEFRQINQEIIDGSAFKSFRMNENNLETKTFSLKVDKLFYEAMGEGKVFEQLATQSYAYF